MGMDERGRSKTGVAVSTASEAGGDSVMRDLRDGSIELLTESELVLARDLAAAVRRLLHLRLAEFHQNVRQLGLREQQRRLRGQYRQQRETVLRDCWRAA